MSQRSHIASSGSTAICVCSAACSEPSSASSGKSSASRSSSSSYQSAWVVNDCGGRSSDLQVDDLVVGQALALVGEDLLGHGDHAEAERHAERRAAVEQALDLRLGLLLGLRVPVAVERGDERAARLDVELADLVGAPEVQVDGAVVDGRRRARRLDGAEQLAVGDVDDRVAVGRGRAQRHARGRDSPRGGAAGSCPLRSTSWPWATSRSA